MNLSQLIVSLSKIQSAHGDLPVYVYSDLWSEEHLLEEGCVVLKSGADPNQEYWLRPSESSPVWKKRVVIG